MRFSALHFSILCCLSFTTDLGHANARMKHKTGIWGQTGIFMNGFLGRGFQITHNIHKQFQLGLSYLQEEQSPIEWWIKDMAEITTTTITSSSLALKEATIDLKTFFYSTFFLDLGLGKRISDFRYGYTYNNTEISSRHFTEASILRVAIGNQWNFDSGINFEITWYGQTQPEARTTKSTVPESNTDPVLEEEGENLGIGIGIISARQMVILALGFAF